MSFVALMTQGGCDVRVVKNGEQAIQLAGERGFDLIALDAHLPEVGSFDTFLRLRQFPAFSSIPIIFIARRFDDAGWRQGLEMGAADYIERPLDGPAFVRRVLSHLKTMPRLDPASKPDSSGKN